MKQILSLFLCLAVLLTLVGCGSKNPASEESSVQPDISETTPTASPVVSVYAAPMDIMSLIWSSMDENDHFPCYGGNQTANPVYDEAGAFDVSDGDMLSYLLLIPEDVQAQITAGADLVHLTNACTFTGAALKIDGDVAAFAKAVEKAVVTQPFVNFAPEVITTISVGNYLVYAFGAAETVEPFVNAALDNLEGAVLLNTAAISFEGNESVSPS